MHCAATLSVLPSRWPSRTFVRRVPRLSSAVEVRAYPPPGSNRGPDQIPPSHPIYAYNHHHCSFYFPTRDSPTSPCPRPLAPHPSTRAARIRNLTKAPALNGQEGVVYSYNADSKRRLGVRLKDGKRLSILPANLTPVDQNPAARLEVTSSEVCSALREAFATLGLGNGTPMAARTID